MDEVKEMAEVSNVELDLASSQLKFFLSLKELEKRDLLDDFFEQMNMKSSVDELGADAAIEKMVLNFSTAGMKNISKNFPEVLDDIHKKIDGQTLYDDFVGIAIDRDQLAPETIDFLKTTKLFESEFPDKDSPSLKERLLASKDSLLAVLGSDKGKVAINAALLGVALGTGGAGILAGAKLAHAVGEMALKNPAVRDLCSRVQDKAVGYLADLGVPVDTIKSGMRLVEHKAQEQIEKRPWLKGKVLPILGIGAAIGGFLLHQNFDSVAKLAGDVFDLDNARSVASSGMNTVLETAHNLDAGKIVESAKGASDHFASKVAGLFGGETPDSTVGFSPDVNPVVDPTVEIPSVADVDPNGIATPDSPAATAPAAAQPEIRNEHIDRDAVSQIQNEHIDRAGTAPAAPEVATPESLHIVSKGESIWNITKGILPEGASNHDIAEGVKAFIAANPDVSSHPNLIFPGDKLLVPDTILSSHTAAIDAVKSMADIKVDVPVIVPEPPALDTTSLTQTTIEPNSTAAIILPDVAKAVKFPTPGLGS
jgi:hypothetical protein